MLIRDKITVVCGLYTFVRRFTTEIIDFIIETSVWQRISSCKENLNFIGRSCQEVSTNQS